MLHCKRLTYKKYDSRPAGGEPPTAGLPSGENGWCLLLEQTRVQRHSVLSISMAADPHAVGAIGGQNHPPLGRRLIYLGQIKTWRYAIKQSTGYGKYVGCARDSEVPSSPGRSAFGVGSRAAICHTHKPCIYRRIF